MPLACPSCRAPVPAANVNITTSLAKCDACNTVFDLRGQVGPLTRPARGRVPMRSSIEIVEDGAPQGGSYREPPKGGRLTIVRRWFTPTLFFLALFCCAWDAFLVFWYSMAIHGPWIAVVFPIAHVAVGAGLTYATVCGFVNRTWIALADGELTVRHGPLPWTGNRTLAAGTVAQLYCEQSTTSRNSDQRPTYGLAALLTSGRKVQLLTGLPEADQALFLEDTLAERMGIVNVPVPGELRTGGVRP